MTARRIRRLTLSATFFLVDGRYPRHGRDPARAFLAASRRSILDSADQLRRAAATRVEVAVAGDLAVASTAAQSFVREARLGVVDLEDPAAIEKSLFADLVESPMLSEVAFTRASAGGFDDQGNRILLPDRRWELGVYRTTAPTRVVTRRTESAAGAWTARLRERAEGDPFASGTLREGTPAEDPTRSATFEVAAARVQEGRPLWSDLHWSELDPGPERRVVMTVQEAVFGPRGDFAGVVRVGLLTDQIDRITQAHVDPADAADPHRVFLCDAQGRLLARLGADDRLALSGDDLRFVPKNPPAAVSAALGLPLLAHMAPGEDATSDLVVDGRRYLATFRGLADTQDWIVGIVVPEAHYTARLQAVRDRFLLLYLVVAAIVLGMGMVASGAVRRGLRRVDDATARMRAFDSDRAPTEAPFRDVEAVLTASSAPRRRCARSASTRRSTSCAASRDNVEPGLAASCAR